jgi:hypothetical protein
VLNGVRPGGIYIYIYMRELGVVEWMMAWSKRSLVKSKHALSTPRRVVLVRDFF